MTFHELIVGVDIDLIETRFREIYPEDVVDVPEVVDYLLGCIPTPGDKKFTIVVGVVPGDEWNDNTPYMDVSGDNAGEHWGLDFTPWSEILAMEVEVSGTIEETIVHILWEITFHGNPAQAAAKLERLEAQADQAFGRINSLLN